MVGAVLDAIRHRSSNSKSDDRSNPSQEKLQLAVLVQEDDLQLAERVQEDDLQLAVLLQEDLQFAVVLLLAILLIYT